MIPILYEKNEERFTSNGLGLLTSCTDCKVTEERNGVYECNFSIPVDAPNFDLVKCGRIIGVSHDETGDVQPFDIVSYTKPLNGVIDFHAVHISYRQSGIVARGTNINSLSAAFNMLSNGLPENPFTYSADFASNAYMAAADGVPRSVRQMLGGVEGSILDTYRGEYEFNKFNVILHRSRGQERDFAIRYGVNMTEYNDESDFSGSYTSCVPYWTGNDNGNDIVVVGSRVDLGVSSYSGRNICVPLDLTDKFEDKPTTAELQNMALSYMRSVSAQLPSQTIKVSFLRIQDMAGYEDYSALLRCNICDTINVVFPRYGMSGRFKIVKTVWNVLAGRYEEMELGALSMSLSEALGITNTTDSLNSINDLSVGGDLAVGGDASIVGTLNASNVQRNGHDYITYKDYTLSITYSAGTVGTRGAEVTANGALANYTPISATIIAGNTYYSSYVARVASGGTITLSAYRATTGARNNDSVTVRVAYRAN